MAQRKVLDVGNCGPDHAAIRRMLESHFDVEVSQADALNDTLDALQAKMFDLVLVNRKLDCDYSDGIRILEHIKADSRFQAVPVMLVTNLAEHQDLAVAAGGERGFGKLELESPATHDLLRTFLA